jgi:hypothetical protein
MALRIIPRAGRPKVLQAGFHALLAADTYTFVDNPGVGSPLLVHLEGSDRTCLEAGGVHALVADFRLIIAVHDFLFHDDPGKGRGVTASAVVIGADDLADAASGTEGFVH